MTKIMTGLILVLFAFGCSKDQVATSDQQIDNASTELESRAQTYNAAWKAGASPSPYLEIYYGDNTMDSVFFFLNVYVWDGSFWDAVCSSEVIRFARQTNDKYVIDDTSTWEDCIMNDGGWPWTTTADDIWNDDPNELEDGKIVVGAAYYKNGTYGGQWTYLDDADCYQCIE